MTLQDAIALLKERLTHVHPLPFAQDDCRAILELLEDQAAQPEPKRHRWQYLWAGCVECQDCNLRIKFPAQESFNLKNDPTKGVCSGTIKVFDYR